MKEKIDDKEQDQWQPLENTPFDSDRVQSINCDTRDFHCGWRLDDKRKNKPHLGIISKEEYRNRFFISLEEVKEILIDLRKRSGGDDKKWRMLSFQKQNGSCLGGGWDFKYLRFFKSEFGWYCQPREEAKVIKIEWLKLPIYEEFLGAH